MQLKNLNLASKLLGELICGWALDPRIRGKVQLDVMYVLYLVLHWQRYTHNAFSEIDIGNELAKKSIPEVLKITS